MNLGSLSFRKLLITGIVVAAGVSALIYFLPFTIYSKIREASATIAAARSRVLYFELATRQSAVNEKRLAVEAEALERIHGVFINPEAPLDFIKSMEGLGREAGVDLTIDLLSATEASGFRLTAIGEAEDVLDFLRRVENAPTILLPDQLTISKLTPEAISTMIASKKFSVRPEVSMIIVAKALPLP